MKVLIDVKDFGVMEVLLLKEHAPKTVENFINLVKNNYFQNSSFHRIIKDFMIQGGMVKMDVNSIEGEFLSNGFNNTLKHERGVISMARTMDPNSATSQFFIVHKDSPHLDGEYAAFGKLVSGFDCLDKIASVSTNSFDAPVDKVIINSIKIKE